jgi:hypothetical protein
MKTKLHLYPFLLLFLISTFYVHAQVGIGTTTPDQSAALDVQSTEKGMLVPRMDSLERVNIQTPATGLLVYQTDQTFGFYFYNGIVWSKVGTVNERWIQNENNISNVNSGNIGIGTNTPEAKLDLQGSLRYNDGTQADSRVLTSDADGNATWQSLKPESLLAPDNLPEPDFSCLSTIGSLGIGGNPRSVAVSGNYAYVVGSDFKVIDVSNPTSPVLSGSLGIGAKSVEISGNYAYVLGSGDFKIIDVTNPANPILSGSIDFSGSVGIGATSLAVSGNYAYVVDTDNDDLKVIDVSNPASPVLSGSLGIGDYPGSVTVSGNYAYVVDSDSDDLKIIELACAPSLAINSLTGDFEIVNVDYNDLTNLPTLFSGSYNDLTNLPTLFSGDYDDLTNLPTIDTPQGFAFNTGYENYNLTYQTVTYYKNDGRVYLEGLLRRLLSTTDKLIGTLPVGYRPSARHIFLAHTDSGPVRIDILPNGEIQFVSKSNKEDAVQDQTLDFDFLSLSGISFSQGN